MKKAIETSDMLMRLRGPQSSARLKEISTQSRLPGALMPTSQDSDGAFKSARNMQNNGPLSSTNSMNIAENTPQGVRSPFPNSSHGKTSVPAMNA